MAILNFVNGNVVTQFFGMVVRLPSAGSALLADASVAANYAHIIGVRLADVAAAATGPVARLENGSVIRMAVEPAVGDAIYLSATVSAGLGVLVAPANAVSLGTCLAKANVGGTWFATVTGNLPGVTPESSPLAASGVVPAFVAGAASIAPGTDELCEYVLTEDRTLAAASVLTLTTTGTPVLGDKMISCYALALGYALSVANGGGTPATIGTIPASLTKPLALVVRWDGTDFTFGQYIHLKTRL